MAATVATLVNPPEQQACSTPRWPRGDARRKQGGGGGGGRQQQKGSRTMPHRAPTFGVWPRPRPHPFASSGSTPCCEGGVKRGQLATARQEQSNSPEETDANPPTVTRGLGVCHHASTADRHRSRLCHRAPARMHPASQPAAAPPLSRDPAPCSCLRRATEARPIGVGTPILTAVRGARRPPAIEPWLTRRRARHQKSLKEREPRKMTLASRHLTNKNSATKKKRREIVF